VVGTNHDGVDVSLGVLVATYMEEEDGGRFMVEVWLLDCKLGVNAVIGDMPAAAANIVNAVDIIITVLLSTYNTAYSYIYIFYKDHVNITSRERAFAEYCIQRYLKYKH